VRSQLKANLGFYPVEVERHVLCTRPGKSLTLDSLDIVSDKEIQTALADQSVSKACTLIGKRGWQPFLLHTVCLISEVPPLPASVHVGYERILSALIFLTPRVAIAARNWAFSRGVHLTLSAAIVVGTGIVRNRVPARHTASALLERTHLATGNTSFT
jgi:hypothetical protein